MQRPPQGCALHRRVPAIRLPRLVWWAECLGRLVILAPDFAVLQARYSLANTVSDSQAGNLYRGNSKPTLSCSQFWLAETSPRRSVASQQNPPAHTSREGRTSLGTSALPLSLALGILASFKRGPFLFKLFWVSSSFPFPHTRYPTPG